MSDPQPHFLLAIHQAAEAEGAALTATQVREVADRLIRDKAHGFTAFDAANTDPAYIRSDVRDVLASINAKAAPVNKPGNADTSGVDPRVWETMTARQKLDAQRRWEAVNKTPSPKVTATSETALIAQKRGFALLAAGTQGSRREAALEGLRAVDAKLKAIRS